MVIFCVFIYFCITYKFSGISEKVMKVYLSVLLIEAVLFEAPVQALS